LAACAGHTATEEGFDELGPFKVGMLMPDAIDRANGAGIDIQCSDQTSAKLPPPAHECMARGENGSGYILQFSNDRLVRAIKLLGDSWNGVAFEQVVKRYGSAIQPDRLAEWEIDAVRVNDRDEPGVVKWHRPDTNRAREIYCDNMDQVTDCVAMVSWFSREMRQAIDSASKPQEYESAMAALWETGPITW